MRIIFDNEDFTKSLSIGFKGKHQLPLITVVVEYFENHPYSPSIFIGADMIWSSSSLWRKPWFWLKRQIRKAQR